MNSETFSYSLQCRSRKCQPAAMKQEAQIIASLDWSQCSAVESIPGKVSGALGVQGYADAGFHCV
jgi:hypothetical protein